MKPKGFARYGEGIRLKMYKIRINPEREDLIIAEDESQALDLYEGEVNLYKEEIKKKQVSKVEMNSEILLVHDFDDIGLERGRHPVYKILSGIDEPQFFASSEY